MAILQLIFLNLGGFLWLHIARSIESRTKSSVVLLLCLNGFMILSFLVVLILLLANSEDVNLLFFHREIQLNASFLMAAAVAGILIFSYPLLYLLFCKGAADNK